MTRFLSLLLLAGCAGQPYWQPVDKPRKDTPRIIMVAHLSCGHTPAGDPISAFGCYSNGVIKLLEGMPPALHDCVLTHELRHHYTGESHRTDRQSHAVDCGDGRIMPLN